MSKRIDFVIGPDGSASVEAHGFQGKECDAATAPFLRALGAEVASKAYKAAPARASQEQRLEQKGG